MEELTNKEKVIMLLNSIENGDKEPVKCINPQSYTQHNLVVADGIEGFGEMIRNAPEEGFKVDIIRAFEDGEYVFTHTQYNFFGEKIGFDIFRFEGGLIVEHWDNLVGKAIPNPSGRTQIDGAVEVSDREKTDENKTLITAFINTVLIGGKMEGLGEYFDGDRYIQHNPQVADGLSGFGKALEEMASSGIHMIYEKVHKILGEGNFILAVSEGVFANEATSFYDLFRIEDGKIAEHWDVIEFIAPQTQWKNKNGKFGNL